MGTPVHRAVDLTRKKTYLLCVGPLSFQGVACTSRHPRHTPIHTYWMQISMDLTSNNTMKHKNTHTEDLVLKPFALLHALATCNHNLYKRVEHCAWSNARPIQVLQSSFCGFNSPNSSNLLLQSFRLRPIGHGQPPVVATICLPFCKRIESIQGSNVLLSENISKLQWLHTLWTSIFHKPLQNVWMPTTQEVTSV